MQILGHAGDLEQRAKPSRPRDGTVRDVLMLMILPEKEEFEIFFWDTTRRTMSAIDTH
jgi:hypothetical protein